MTETFDNNNVPLPHSNDIELEVVPDRMMTPDEILEREYGITEVAHTPSFGDASTIARFTKTATIFSGNMSIICSTLGTGVLSLPYSMHELGMIPGVTLIVVLAVICVWTMWMLQEVGTALCKEEQVKANTLSQDFNVSYTWVGAKVLPKSGVFLEFVLFMISVGAVIAFVVAFCDCLTSVMKFIIDGPESISSSSSNNNNNNNNNSTINGSNINSDEAFYKKMLKSRLFWSIVIYVIDAPLSYAKSLNAFRYFSFFILPCISYLIFILIYYTVKEGTNPVNYVPASIEGIKAIPIVTFVYTGHLNFYNVFRELGPHDRKRRSMATVYLSTGIVAVVYVIVSVLGYLYCGKSVDGNIFNSLPNDSVLVAIARIAISINVLIGLPFLVAPGREGINAMLSHAEKYAELHPNLKHVIGNTIILVLGVIGWFVTSISTVLGFCGAVGSSSISFIFPGTYYYFTFRNEPTRKISRTLSVVCIVIGFVIMVVGLVLQIVSVV